MSRNLLRSNRIRALTQEARLLLALVEQLEALATDRVSGSLGHLTILQGQAEGLREAASLLRKRVGR